VSEVVADRRDHAGRHRKGDGTANGGDGAEESSGKILMLTGRYGDTGNAKDERGDEASKDSWSVPVLEGLPVGTIRAKVSSDREAAEQENGSSRTRV
jgi:hypothetical protein